MTLATLLAEAAAAAIITARPISAAWGVHRLTGA